MAAGTDGKSRIAAGGDKTVSQLYNKKRIKLSSDFRRAYRVFPSAAAATE
jgi:hypothetical protein